MDLIRVALCDDYKELVKSYKEYIELEPDMVVPAVFFSAKECLEKIGSVDVDLLLLDIQMETKTAGIDIIQDIKKIKPDLKIVMLTSYNDDEYAQILAAVDPGRPLAAEIRELSLKAAVETLAAKRRG